MADGSPTITTIESITEFERFGAYTSARLCTFTEASTLDGQ